MSFDDISGRRFGRLVAKERFGAKWSFVCDCGNEKTIFAGNVRRGLTKSCGCLNKEAAAARNALTKTTHGQTKTSEYRAWQSIHQRCSNQNDKDYNKYGARGISVSPEWSTFEQFIADMGKKPSPRHSIERVDVDGNYEKSNCCWATYKEQNANKRSNVRVSAFGKTGCLADFIPSKSPQYQKARRLRFKGADPASAINSVQAAAS